MRKKRISGSWRKLHGRENGKPSEHAKPVWSKLRGRIGTLHDTGKNYLQRKERERMKLQRKALRHYLDYTFKRELKSAAWEVLGDDIEDMSVELNPDTDQKERDSRTDQNLRQRLNINDL